MDEYPPILDNLHYSEGPPGEIPGGIYFPMKYNAKKTIVDGITFDSKQEAARYRELKLLERAGKIRNLELQKRFELIPPQRDAGRLAERAAYYKADFCYDERSDELNAWLPVVEDCKGVKTRDYILKRKLMLWVHGIRIRET